MMKAVQPRPKPIDAQEKRPKPMESRERLSHKITMATMEAKSGLTRRIVPPNATPSPAAAATRELLEDKLTSVIKVIF